MEVQYCMACGHQAMDSLRWPAVTNMRANGDGERKGLFEPFAYKNNASFYQDRLGTNIGKAALKNRTPFSLLGGLDVPTLAYAAFLQGPLGETRPFLSHFKVLRTQTDHFTRTGSGQTQ
jgi:hypothetical protein